MALSLQNASSWFFLLNRDDPEKHRRTAAALNRLLLEPNTPAVLKSAQKRFLSILPNSKDEPARLFSVWLLGLHGDAEVLDSLLNASLHDRKVAVRKMAASSIASLGEKKGFGKFLTSPQFFLLERL